MAQEEWVSIPGVHAVSDGLVLICDVDGRRFGVPLNRIARHSEVRQVGDRGRLVIPRELAFHLGLAADAT